MYLRNSEDRDALVFVTQKGQKTDMRRPVDWMKDNILKGVDFLTDEQYKNLTAKGFRKV